ncbi:hypothetical protein HZS_3279, partial [Henneguya salminicola]
MEGHLLKFVNFLMGWQDRYFVLDVFGGSLTYYLNESDKQLSIIRGKVDLKETRLVKDSLDSNILVIEAPNTQWRLKEENKDKYKEWATQIKLSIELGSKGLKSRIVSPPPVPIHSLKTAQSQKLNSPKLFTHKSFRTHSSILNSDKKYNDSEILEKFSLIKSNIRDLYAIIQNVINTIKKQSLDETCQFNKVIGDQIYKKISDILTLLQLSHRVR